MPTIACPRCQKQYKVPASAAGQKATCKACGKQFRLGKARVEVAAPSGSANSAAPIGKPARLPAASESASPKKEPKRESDAFWNDALTEPAPKPPAARRAEAVTRRPDAPKGSGKPKKKKKKGSGFRWGADWGKVGGGLAVFLVAGGITAGLVITTGYLYFWPAGIAVVGFFTALSGLMGEEGVW